MHEVAQSSAFFRAVTFILQNLAKRDGRETVAIKNDIAQPHRKRLVRVRRVTQISRDASRGPVSPALPPDIPRAETFRKQKRTYADIGRYVERVQCKQDFFTGPNFLFARSCALEFFKHRLCRKRCRFTIVGSCVPEVCQNPLRQRRKHVEHCYAMQSEFKSAGQFVRSTRRTYRSHNFRRVSRSPTPAIQLNQGPDLGWDKFSSTLHTPNKLPLFLPLSCRRSWVIELPPQITSVLLAYARILNARQRSAANAGEASPRKKVNSPRGCETKNAMLYQ